MRIIDAFPGDAPQDGQKKMAYVNAKYHQVRSLYHFVIDVLRKIFFRNINFYFLKTLSVTWLLKSHSSLNKTKHLINNI